MYQKDHSISPDQNIHLSDRTDRSYLYWCLCFCVLAACLICSPEARAKDKQLSPGEFKRIQQVQTLQTEARWNEARKVIRQHLKDEPRPLLEAMLWRSLAQVELQDAHYEKALPALKKAWGLKQLSDEEQLSLQGIMSQLMLQQEEYKEGIPLFLDWLSKTPEDKHEARHYLALAQAYTVQEKWKPALPHAKKAVAMKSKKDTVPVSWYQLLVSLHTRLEQWPQAIRMQKVVLDRQAGEIRQWRQLALLQYQSQPEKKRKRSSGFPKSALATLRTAWEKGLFDKANDYQMLAQWFSLNDLPYKAARVLEDGFKKQAFKAKNSKQQRRIRRQMAGLWLRAKELGQAEQVLAQLVRQKPDKKMLQQIARIQIRQQKWSNAEKSLKKLLAMQPKNPGDVLLLHGITLLQLEKLDQAEGQFLLARKNKRNQHSAKQWLQYLASIR